MAYNFCPICPPQILIIRRINMSSKTIRSKFVHNHTIQELFRAKSIEFTCLLSTQEQVQSHKATLTLTQRSLGEPRWYLDGSPLTSYEPNCSERLFRVVNPLQLLLSLSANLFPYSFSVEICNKYDNLQIELYILQLDSEAVVTEWFPC